MAHRSTLIRFASAACLVPLGLLGPVRHASAQAADPGALDVQPSDARALQATDGLPGSPTGAIIPMPEDTSPPQIRSTIPGNGPEAPDRLAPNYGKPRKPRPVLFQMKPKLYAPPMAVPLTPLVPYRGAPGTRGRTNRPDTRGTEPLLPPPPTVAMPGGRPQVPPRLRRTLIEEDDPFAPVGVDMGGFIVKPFVQGSTGYETNPNQVATGRKPSAVLRVDGGFTASGDVGSTALTADLRGGYSDFPSNSNANRPDATGTIDSRTDVTRDDAINSELRFTVATQTPGSPLLANPTAAVVVNRPSIVSEGGTLGETHLFGPLSVALKGTIDRTQYGDGVESDGTIARFSYDNYNDYGIVGRVAYDMSPAIAPFVEASGDWRVRDNPVDLYGYARNSVGVTGRAGVTLSLFGLLTGNISGGYLERHYDDPRLVHLQGPTADGSLTYAATRLTSITVRANTTASETTLAGAAGALSRTFGIEVAHRLFRNFTVSGIATETINEYQGVTGTEHYGTLTLKSAYNFNREVQLVASASRQSLQSTFQGQGFKDYVFLTGVRLQR